jgi:zinc protease
MADRVANGLLYGRETPHGHPISGREAAVEALDRAELVDHHERSFLRGRPTFMLVGDIDTATAVRQLEEAFSGWRSLDGDTPTVVATSERQPTAIYLVDKQGAAQSVIAAGQVTVGRLHPDYLPLVLMNHAFGGQFTARLNMNLREDKGYSYGYRSRFDWRKSLSNFSAGGSVQTAVTKESVIETLKEVRGLRADRPISEDEFTKSQLSLIRGFPPTFETPGQILRRLIDIVHYGLPDDYFSGHVERLRAVTLADVQRVATEHVDPDRLSIVIVGDRATIEEPLQELNLPIVHLDHEGLPLE